MSGYEPGSDNSDKAWEIIGHCEGTIDSIPSAVLDEIELAVGGPAPYSPDDGDSDQVFVTSGVTSGGCSIAYQRDQFPHEVYCNQRAPGEVAEGFKVRIASQFQPL
jgi:hypothetical protein